MDDVNITMNKIETIKHKTNQYLHGGVVLRVEHLSKKFCRTLKRSMFYGTIDIMRSMLGIPYDTGKLRKDEFWALDDVSFELRKGETLGIIGENGSGKSTLLRLITGIFPPDRGRITFKGRIGALIAVGAGFHPHMTGRENVYLNGTILGMTRKEIDEKFDEIVEFADISEFIDAPVNTYSSGMRVRLGFSIAVHGNPDILLVDEILSVGDLSFRNKSMRKMAEFREKANALIFISHNIDQVQVLCSKAILLHNGKVLFAGPTEKTILKYEKLVAESTFEKSNKAPKKGIFFNELIETIEACLIDENGRKINKIKSGSDIIILYHFIAKIDIEKPIIGIGIRNDQNINIVYETNMYSNKDFIIPSLKRGKEYKVSAIFKNIRLSTGVYSINCGFRNGDTYEVYNKILNDKFKVFDVEETPFVVLNDDKKLGILSVDSEWEIKELN